MRFKRRSDSPLRKKAKQGFRGFPAATIAFYGPDDQRASKVAVGILPSEDGEPLAMGRWFTEGTDIRQDRNVAQAILAYVQQYGVKSVLSVDRIIGCPHEEGMDYPDGEACPHCLFWANLDRWTGDRHQ